MLRILLVIGLCCFDSVLSSSCQKLRCHTQNPCPHGYQKGPDLCETCDCVNPCKDKKCEGGRTCYVTKKGGQCLKCDGGPVTCESDCPSGYKTNDGDNCIICKCVDWCDKIKCGEDEVCAIRDGLFSCSAKDALMKPTVTLSASQEVFSEGDIFTLSCEIDSDAAVKDITWDFLGVSSPSPPHVVVSPHGRFLSIVMATPDQAGKYRCVAHGDFGSVPAEIAIDIIASVKPTITNITPNISALANSSVVLECEATGKPEPVIYWMKDGIFLHTGGYRKKYCNGTLVLSEVNKHDEGTYTCVASNIGGEDRAETKLDVTSLDYNFENVNVDTLIRLLEQVKYQVHETVIDTISDNKDTTKHRSPEELLRLFKFPSSKATKVAESGEVFEQAIQRIFNEISPSEYLSFADVFRSDQITLIAKLAGCKTPELSSHDQCTDFCFHQKYRTYDGTCNNFRHPEFGSSVTPMVRLLPAAYDNALNYPKGWRPEIEYNNFPLPSARKASMKLAKAQDITEDKHFTHMVMQWGQFVDHDVGLTPLAITSTVYSADWSCGFNHPCFPILLPEDDPRKNVTECISFFRSSATCSISEDYQNIGTREQINEITSYIDGSQVYGSDDEQAESLRDMDSDEGLLRIGVMMPSGKPLLPPNTGEPIACDVDSTASFFPCFQAGDVRANEQPGLLSVHTLWFREHNRIAKQLAEINPQWDGETIYQEARKIVGAELQHITFNHWLPIIIGQQGMELIGEYQGYDPSVNAGLSNVFGTAAFRFGHAIIHPIIKRLDCTFNPIKQGNLPLHLAFFNPKTVVTDGGIDAVVRGLFGSPAKELNPYQLLNTELTERLFELAHEIGLDLAALNIQRGRDHGLPGYNAFREYCGLQRAQNFDDFQDEIGDPQIREKLETLYGHPDNVDVWLGGLLEEHVDGGIVGPTFQCILVEQMRRLRDGDRFWYENHGVFTPAQKTEIKQTSLARIICDNSDAIEHVQKNVFLRATYPDGMVTCSDKHLSFVELRLWKQCD